MNQNPQSNRHKLSIRVLAYIMLSSAVFTLIGTGVQLLLEYNRDINYVKRSIDQIEKGFAKSIASSLWSLDEIQLKHNLEGAIHVPNIQYLEVRETSDNPTPLIEKMGTPDTKNTISKTIILVYGPDSSKIGTLKIIANKDEAFLHLKKSAFTILTTQAIKTFLMSICILLIFHFLVMRHLNHLEDYFSKLNFKKLSNKLTLNKKHTAGSEDELDHLADSINQMQENLERSIQQKRKSDAHLIDSEKRFRNYIENAPYGIFVADFNGTFIEINKKFEEITGYSKQELFKESMYLMGGDDGKPFVSGMLTAIKETGKFTGECNAHRKNGEIGICSLGIIKLTEEKLLAFVNDITNAKKLENQLHQADKMQSLGQLAGGIAHDFNNQLSSIQGFVELIKINSTKEEKNHEFAANIEKLVKRSGEMIKNILAFSKKGKEEFVDVDIHSLINEVNTIIHQSVDKRITVSKKLDAESYIIKGSPSQIQNVILNMVINAKDAIEKEGHISLTTDNQYFDSRKIKSINPNLSPGEYITISIKDDGSGIDEETQKHIFEMFFTTKAYGTGMGLASSFDTIKNHKGSITVKSKPKEGTKFTIYLPLSMEKNGKTNLDSTTKRNPKSKKGKANILIIDDEKTIAETLQLGLMAFDYTSTVYNNGAEAIEYFKEHWKEIDLVTMDMLMPNLTGREVFERLKLINPKVKCIILSGYSDEEDMQYLLDLGLKGFLNKPFTLDELLIKISMALD